MLADKAVHGRLQKLNVPSVRAKPTINYLYKTIKSWTSKTVTITCIMMSKIEPEMATPITIVTRIVKNSQTLIVSFVAS